MAFFKYRGRRVRKWDDRLILRSVIFCVMGFALAGIFMTYSQDAVISIWERPLWNRIATAVLFDLMMMVVLIVGVKRQETLYRNMQNREALARMLIDNGWYETDMKTAASGERNLLYFPLLYWWRRRAITYFPKLYYRRKKDVIEVWVKISMGRYQDQLLHLESKIETGLNCELIASVYIDTWQHYTFLCAVEENRIQIGDIREKGGEIAFMKHIAWDYDSHPHALIVGGTGSGKTSFVLSLIEILLERKAKLFIVDAKNADLAGLERTLPDVYYEKEKIKECVERFYEAMMNRMTEIKQRSDYAPGKNYAKFGLSPNFLIFDEYVAFMEMLPKKEWEDTISVLKKIILLGRQAGYFVVLTCQRPDAKYMPDGMRDQFGFRVALGNMETSGYTMMFGSTEKTFLTKDIKGRGYVELWDGVITEFYAPFIPANHDFFKEIGERYRRSCTGEVRELEEHTQEDATARDA